MSGFNYEEFDQMVGRVERLGADMDRVSKDVLNAGCEPARQAFAKKIPYDSKTPRNKRRHEHARKNIISTRTKKSRSGSKYRVIKARDETFNYLWYREKGTSKMEARPFAEAAYKAARKAAVGPMKQALLKALNKHLN